jgi:hypothetical protein
LDFIFFQIKLLILRYISKNLILKIKIEKKNSRDRYITQQKNNKKVTKYNSQNILILILKYKIKK